MKRFHFVLPAFLLFVASVVAQPVIIEARFKQLDTNGDGKLSADEVKAAPAALQQRLKGADKDGDGFLTLAEVQAHFGQPAAKPKDPAPIPKADPVREAPKVLAPDVRG